MIRVIHILLSRLQISLRKRALRLAKIAVHPAHRRQYIPANIHPLRLLLPTDTLHPRPCRIRPRLKIHQPVLHLANLLR